MGYLVGSDSYTEVRGQGLLQVHMFLNTIAWEAGDISVLWACGDENQSGGSWEVIADGWNIIANVSQTSGADRLAGMFWKELEPNEDEFPFFQVDTPTVGADTLTSIWGVWRGVTPEFDVIAVTTPGGAADSATPPITTALPVGFIVSAYYHVGDGNTPTAPSGYTLMPALYEDPFFTTLAYKTRTGAGLETPGNWGSTPPMGTAEEILVTAAWGNDVTELEALTVVHPG